MAKKNSKGSKKSRASGMGRIVVTMDKILSFVDKNEKVLTKWGQGDLASALSDVKAAVEDVRDAATELVEKGFEPPKKTASSRFVPGTQIKVSPDKIDLYPNIKTSDVLEIKGPGPVRGTVWTTSNMVVAKSHVRVAEKSI